MSTPPAPDASDESSQEAWRNQRRMALGLRAASAVLPGGDPHARPWGHGSERLRGGWRGRHRAAAAEGWSGRDGRGNRRAGSHRGGAVGGGRRCSLRGRSAGRARSLGSAGIGGGDAAVALH